MELKAWNLALETLVMMTDEEFNEILRVALSERSEERLDWSTGFAVETTVGSTTYVVEQ